MGTKEELFQFLKRSLAKSLPESVKAGLRPWIYGIFFPVKRSAYKAGCDKSKLAAMSLPKVSAPLVSIIIPAYNGFSQTLCCIYSIIENTRDIKYEVILADDNSTDGTKDIQKNVRNLIVARAGENLGFLKNCNNAAKLARGKYIVLLNNDTYVQENWLASLVKTAETDEKVGIVGSKLVYANGRLQEAGGIIKEEGRAENYGKFMDPSLPEFNYVREADYVSGACMLVRKTLWKAAGGFDERYAPAYYEDTDLAFEARKRGYKVIYQPASVVVHFEGMSHGTDTSKGIKKYQEINRVKFWGKWAAALRKGKGTGKKTMVFIDRSLPEFDRDCGSRMVMHHMEFFLKRGFNIKYLPDNFHATEPYASILGQLGVEVLAGRRYRNGWKKWFMENSGIDYAYINRPGVAAKYIDFIKKETRAKVFYQGHDLHYVREQRRAGVEGGTGRESYWKQVEEKILKTADHSFYPSVTDVERARGDFSGVHVNYAPMYAFDAPPAQKYDMKKRQGLIFVGGFGHLPNADGVKWFCAEVMPLVLKKMPAMKIHIVGSNPPPEIKALGNENVIIEGYLPDEELEKLYARCRLAVAPLRYGAGLKGKIIEAMYRGLPVVTTGTGAEGIDRRMLFISDDPAGFAGLIVDNYNSSGLNALSKKIRANAMKMFSKKALEASFKGVL